MKSLYLFILEKFKINSKTAKKWTIKNAEDGDFIKWRNIYFIYKDININHKYSDNLDDNAIIYHAVYNKRTKNIRIGQGGGVGSSMSVSNYELLNDDEKKEFNKVLKDNGYEWDENKKELVKL